MILGHSFLGNSMLQILAIVSAVALFAIWSLVTSVYNSNSFIWCFCSWFSLSQMLFSLPDIVSTLFIKVPLACLKSEGWLSSIRIQVPIWMNSTGCYSLKFKRSVSLYVRSSATIDFTASNISFANYYTFILISFIFIIL